MKYAIIDENNIVVNLVKANEPLDASWIQTDTANIDDVYDGTSFTKPISPLDELKSQKIQSITLDPKAPVVINGVTFNGGDSSASAISGAVTLAQALGETDVKLWDVDNVIATYTFDDATAIAAQIAKAYRDAQFAKYALIAQINACTTVADLDAIVV